MFKSIIKEASPSAIVHMINGIYKKNYPLHATNVKIEPTEFIKENPKSGKLEKYVSDIVITLSSESQKDTYFIEAQINDDFEMSLRIFNYSVLIALERRTVSDDGSCMEIDMPSPAVIYWETSRTRDVVSIRINFPNNKSILYKVPTFKVLQHSVSELEGMALLLPFYILKIREELKKKGTDSEKRKELSRELEGYVIEICKTFDRCKKNNYITEKDLAILLRRLSRLNNELYGEYEEFTEVDMALKQYESSGICELVAEVEKRSLKQGISQGLSQGINQGLIKTAKAMKAGGEAVSKIMRYTGLSRREISAL